MELTKPTTAIDGDRIYFRLLTEEDATQAYCDWLNDPEVNKYLATKHATIPELRQYIIDRNKDPKSILLGIFIKDGDVHIGNTKFELVGPEERPDVAIVIGAKDYWGKGFATEVIRLLTNYVTRDLDFDTVTLGVLGDNKAAIKAYEKVGYTIDRIEERSIKHEGDDEYHDQIWMSIKKPTTDL